MYAPFDLHGQVALVTGGNSGIGRAMADALAAAGAAVAIWGRRADRNAQAVAELRAAAGVDASAVEVDVSDEDAVRDAFAATVARHGRVDTAIVNAGTGGERVALHEMPTDEYRRVLATNLDGAVFTLRAAAGHMAGRGGGGSIVTIGSLAAVMGRPYQAAYTASKGALVAVTQSVAAEYARYGVRANTIQPGWVATEMIDEEFLRRPISQARLARIPLGRWGRPADFGGLAVYLASPASAYQTGSVILVDGGYATAAP